MERGELFKKTMLVIGTLVCLIIILLLLDHPFIQLPETRVPGK